MRSQVPDLLHGGEHRVYGDAQYAGQRAQIKARSPQARDFTQYRGRGYKSLTERQRSNLENAFIAVIGPQFDPFRGPSLGRSIYLPTVGTGRQSGSATSRFRRSRTRCAGDR